MGPLLCLPLSAQHGVGTALAYAVARAWSLLLLVALWCLIV